MGFVIRGDGEGGRNFDFEEGRCDLCDMALIFVKIDDCINLMPHSF